MKAPVLKPTKASPLVTLPSGNTKTGKSDGSFAILTSLLDTLDEESDLSTKINSKNRYADFV